MSQPIAFIGAGKMVSAIVKSLLRTDSFTQEQLSCCSANDGTSERLSSETGIIRFDTVEEMLSTKPSALVLGCKPQQLGELPSSMIDKASDCLILSIMAGITFPACLKSLPMPEILSDPCQIPPWTDR